MRLYSFLVYVVLHCYTMTEGGKNTTKKTGDHNWDMERMQFQKEQGNVSSGTDYINRNSKGNDVKEALGDSRSGDV